MDGVVGASSSDEMRVEHETTAQGMELHAPQDQDAETNKSQKLNEPETNESVAATTQRASIFSLAVSLASHAGRVITLPHTKRMSTDVNEGDTSPPPADDRETEHKSKAIPRTTASPAVLPWQTRDDQTGAVVDDLEIRQKILELTVFRSTYTDHPGGEEEYVFDYAKHKAVAMELLLRDPNLREMHNVLVPTIVSDVAFWRNFFLRCNALCVDSSRATSYLPEAKSTYSNVAAIASFQRFKREMLLRRQRSADRQRRSHTFNGPEPEMELGEWDLDLDGEIDKELTRRRPSRAADHCVHTHTT